MRMEAHIGGPYTNSKLDTYANCIKVLLDHFLQPNSAAMMKFHCNHGLFLPLHATFVHAHSAKINDDDFVDNKINNREDRTTKKAINQQQ